MTCHSTIRAARLLALALVLATGAGCAADRGTGVGAGGSDGALPLPLAAAPGSPTLLQCAPAAEEQTTTALIGPLGGTLSLGATSVVIPRDAVLAPTTFRLTIPASPLVEIAVRAGSAEHFVFAQPVLMTIDYGRCAASVPALQPLSVWHIDETSKALLENMGGVDFRALHVITFYTGHLSGYAVAD